MRSRILILVMLLLANASLARGQSTGANDVPPQVPSQPQLPEASSWRSLFAITEARRPIAESAEEAENIVSKPLRFWVRTEYLTWWIKTANTPILVTSGSPTDPSPGALNSVNTTVLFGGNGLDFFDRKGGRFTGGWSFDDECTLGLEASYFFMSGRAINQTSVSPGAPVLANPFFNVNTGQPDSSLVTYPGVMSGQIFVDMPSFLQGADANVSVALWHGEHFRVDGLAGFRWLNLQEGLHFTESSLVQLASQYVGLVPFDGNTISVSDRFDTHNNFYGAQIGARAEWQVKRWTLSLLAKVAFGASNEVVQIHGSTTIDTQPATVSNGGLYAVSSNSGQFTRNAFAVVPEANLNLSFQVNDHVRLFAGYTFLYWTSVARPGDQIDTSINTNLVPTSMTFGAAGGPARPGFSFHSTDFFAHGVNAGLEIRY